MTKAKKVSKAGRTDPIAQVRRERDQWRATALSQRLEKETAQRLLAESEALVADLRGEAEYQETRRRYLEKQRAEFDGQACEATAGLVYSSLNPKNARSALILALGAHRLAQGEASYAEGLVKALRSELGGERARLERLRTELGGERARLERLRTTIRTWAESYFAADDPARAWVLSLLDPVEECGGVVAMGSGSSIAVAAEGKSA